MKPTLEQIVNELQKKKTKPFELSNYLFDKQLEFVNDPARFKLAVTTRRSGKTVSCAADLLFTALSDSFLVCLYITLSRANAKRLVWKELKKIDKKFSLNFKFNESELSAEAPNGSVVYCSGASDRTEIEKFRGLALKKVYIDEGQSFPGYIEELVDEVLGPALMDHLGSLIMIGTPGPVPTGYFYECSNGKFSKAWSHHFWTSFQNPHLENPQLAIDQEIARMGVDASHPKIQREWYGKWVLDTDSLVYHYDERVNHYEELPQGSYTYVLGVDLGFNDADAIAVLAWSDASRYTYLVEEKVTRKQTITDLVHQIEYLRNKYDVSKIIVDQGGLGKKIAEEVTRRYGIPVKAAEKIRKAEFIELLNDDLRAGRFKAKRGSRFADDAMKVEWDMDKSTPDKKVISKRFHSDICEAALYAWRESYSFTHVPGKAMPKIGTPEWAQEQEDEMEEAALAYFKAKEDEENGNGVY